MMLRTAGPAQWKLNRKTGLDLLIHGSGDLRLHHRSAAHVVVDFGSLLDSVPDKLAIFA